MSPDEHRPNGVYVHVPFCATRCDYCAFATWTDRTHLAEEYLRCVRVEIERAVADGMAPATTVFVGGGTPTAVPPDALAEVIAAIPRTPGAEVTVECNPDDVTLEMTTAFAGAGVNRVSIGVQSMAPHVLVALGRTHRPENVARAVECARSAGLTSFNLDLIYGAVGETVADWSSTVSAALDLDPPHVSAYGLTVEAGTALAATPQRHPDDDDQADKYEIADSALTAAGLANYEVSNWALPGHESRHNLLYWHQHDYRGVGCAAHSHRDGRRWWNVRTPERYIDLVTRGEPVEASAEALDDETRRFERLQLGLRTRDGVESGAFAPETLELLAGMVVPHPDDPGRVVLTRAGRLMADDISTRFAPAPHGDVAVVVSVPAEGA
ncbi:radical SAM family heme chaperone HemW [Ilumatobacter sp.]|uniref:radical SAM family heme chaperone HemW n=1 Tax=Ilumatobacter sp. TaxID=1967498 RepID=UPI003B5203EF